MARPAWSGSLGFGLVSIPVSLFGGVRDRSVRFRQLHAPDGSPVELRRVCAQEGREVPWEEVAKGYELPDGRWVLLSEEELEAAAPERTRTIEVERFVGEQEIDPIYYEHHYLVAPREGGGRAYGLLEEALRGSQRAALGRFVMRSREALVSVYSREGTLTLSTMRFHDEVRAPAQIADGIRAGAPGRTEVGRALAVIEELSGRFDPGEYRDEHRERLLEVVAHKQQGEEALDAPAPARERPTPASDLMDALERSLARIRERAA